MSAEQTTRETVTTPQGVLPIEPDEHGNSYVTFGDGTAAVHAGGSWWLIEEHGVREGIAS